MNSPPQVAAAKSQLHLQTVSKEIRHAAAREKHVQAVARSTARPARRLEALFRAGRHTCCLSTSFAV